MTSTERAVIDRYKQDVPVDITAMATGLGISVYDDTELPDGISGSIRRDGDGYRIDVNPSDSYRRQRFTIAHECAHYLLHRNKIGDGITDDAMYRSDKMTTAEEYEANNTAAELLMPRASVLDRYGNGTNTYIGLADLFAVSVPAMRTRLKYLLYLR